MLNSVALMIKIHPDYGVFEVPFLGTLRYVPSYLASVWFFSVGKALLDVLGKFLNIQP